ncbi:hypothetical protein I3843_10G114300 [Carya illinoinensis]|nr:hypothetical protein I3843_10G114300 [Carya illinoinensis]
MKLHPHENHLLTATVHGKSPDHPTLPRSRLHDGRQASITLYFRHLKTEQGKLSLCAFFFLTMLHDRSHRT